MENAPADYLQVPITERERVDAHRRSRSIERLIPDAESVYSQPFDDDRPDSISAGPSRYPSIRGEPTPITPGQQRRFHSYQGAQYAPISPIDEEDIADAASDVPSRPRTIPQSEKSFEPLVPLPNLWTPIWLRRSTLAGFTVFFSVSIVALIVLWVLSATRSGFEIHFEGPHHEWWVYIPTVAVVLLVGLWRQVDFHTKALTPWDELQKGPISAAKSLLLNYVSPLQIVALFQAFVQNHIPIVATVSSFMFLKIITVFSTGLFILLPKDVSQGSFPLISTSRFDSANANDVTSAPVSAYYGNVYQGIPPQPGVGADLAYAPFRYDDNRNESLAENATFTADVDAFVPIITCRSVDATLDGNSTVEQSASGDAFGGGIRLSIPSDDTCDNWSAMTIAALNPQLQVAPASQVYGSTQALSCGRDNGTAALLFTVLDVSYEQDVRDGATQLALAGEEVATSSSRTVSNMANVICEVGYTITRIQVSNDTLKQDTPSQGISTDTVSNAENRTLDNFSNGDLMTAFEGVASAGGSLFGQVLGADETSGFFTLLALDHGTRDVSRLLNGDDLSSAVETTFKGVMAQFAHLSLSVPAEDDIQGRAIRRETRYVVNDPSAALMIGALTVAIIAAFILLFNAPRAVVPRDPTSIAATAATLTNSVELNRLLRRGGVPSENNLEASLDGYEFGTAIATTEHGQASFKIVTSEGIKDPNAPKPVNTLRWWHPITSSIPFAVVVLAIPFLLIGMLELTQKQSEDGGIIGVPDTQATDIYTHYIPSLVMVILASLLNMIDFDILVFTPWNAMAAGGASPRESILAHYLGITSPWALFEAIKVRHLNVVLSSIATMIASILAIVAAGLYNVDAFTSEGTSIALTQASRFNLEWSNSAVSDNGAAGLISAVLHDNLSYPAFTYRHLALPSFTLDSGDLDTGNGSTRTTTTNATEVGMDVLQGDLQCYLVDRNFLTLTQSDDQVSVEIRAALPDSCALGGTSGDGTFITYTNIFSIPSDNPVFGGRQTDLLFGSGAEMIGNALNSTNQNLSSLIEDNPAVGCPSQGFTFGRFSRDTNVDDITSMLCYQRIQKVSASFSIVSNTTTIDANRPINIDGSDMELQRNPLSTDGDNTVFNFRIQAALNRAVRPFPGSDDPNEFDVDGFFQGVLNTDDHDSRPLDPATLIGEDNETNLLDAVLDFYRLYMAQAISINMREGSDSPANGNGTLLNNLTPRQDASSPLATIATTISSPRLVQDSTSKLLLQVLLGLTSGLMAAAWALTRFRRVLPLDPNSIAGAMSLLAGGDLAHCADDGLCECCGKPRRNSFGTIAEQRPVSVHAAAATQSMLSEGEREGVIPVGAEWFAGEGRGGRGQWGLVFTGRVFSLGWWRENRALGRRRRWGVDVGERADGNGDEDWELGAKRLRAGGDVSPGMRFEMRDMESMRGRQSESRSLEVPSDPREGGYGEGGLRSESRGDSGSMERGRGIAADASEAGSRDGSVDVGEERRGGFGGAGGMNYSRGGYQRVEGDGDYRGEA